MANVTFTIPDTKIQHFIDCYGEDYDRQVADGNIDGQAVSKTDHAKNEAFKFLAERVRKWTKQQQVNQLIGEDITQ